MSRDFKWKLKLGYDLISAKLTNNNIPFFVQISITTNCNLRCGYCYAVYPERKIKNIPKEKWFKVIDELASLGTRRISLLGGEPFLRQDLGEIIDYIKSNDIECAATSNGTLIPAKIDIAKKLDLLCISLDGNKVSHDLNRGEGSFEKALTAIESAHKNNIKLQVAATLTKYNINDESLNYLFELSKKYKFLIGFSTLVNQLHDGVQSPITKMIPSDDDYRKVLKKIEQAKKNGANILFSEKTHRYARNWSFSYSIDKISWKPKFPHPKCHAGIFYCIIDTDGKVYPCPQLVGASRALNCIEIGFKEAWEFISKHDCTACTAPCTTEFNYLFSLEPHVILNQIKNTDKGASND